MKNSNKLLLLGISLSAIPTLVSANASMEAADKLYQDGNCEKAIESYSSLMNTNIKPEEKDTAIFRTAYCQFNLGNYQESEKGFKQYLTTHKTEEEAILKYAQSLLNNGKYSQAETAAKAIKSNDFKFDAKIVQARVKIETERFDDALSILNSEASNPEAIYWKAVAYYRADRDEESEKTFKEAMDKASNDSWVKPDAKSWLESLEQSKQKFHFKVTVGAIYDSNIDQSGNSGTASVGSGGEIDPSKTKANYSNSNYTIGRGSYVGVDLYHNTYTSRKFSVVTTASASTPFYSGHAAYNNQNASLDITGKYTQSDKLNYSTSFKYLDSFYNGKYSQDYGYVTPAVSWSFAPNYWLKLSLPYTKYFNKKSIELLSATLDLSYDPTNWNSLYIGGGYVKSNAPYTRVNGNPPTVLSGTISSHYHTMNIYAGTAFYYDNYTLSLYGYYYKSSYELEDFFKAQAGQKPREDKLKILSVSLSKTFLQNFTASLSYSHYDNKSEGFPGLIYGQTVTNNTYTRGYLLGTISYYY